MNNPVAPHESREVAVAIIGGGLAGSAAAAVLAENGLAPVIIERDSFPRDKLCGEFLSGESTRLLERIGCLDKLLEHQPPKITHVRFFSVRGRMLDVPLPESAYGISRQLLDETLFRNAGSKGAVCMEGYEVRKIGSGPSGGRLLSLGKAGDRSDSVESHTLSAALTIAAYGRQSKLDRDLNRQFIHNMQPGVGLKLHHRIAGGGDAQATVTALENHAEIYAIDGGYCGICRVEAGQINVCMLLQKKTFQAIGSSDWGSISDFLASRNTALATRLRSLTPCGSKPLIVSGMPFSTKDQSLEDVLFAGDAAGMITPLCGDGQAMALEAGIALAELIKAIFVSSAGITPQTVIDSPLAELWNQRWKTRFNMRMHLGRVLHHAMLHPTLSDLTIRALRMAPPAITRQLAASTRSTASET